MTVNFVFKSPVFPASFLPENLDTQMKKAIANFDMGRVKEFLSKGESGDQKVLLSYANRQQRYACIKDKALMLDMLEEDYSFWEETVNRPEEVKKDFDQLFAWLSEGEFSSDRFLQLYCEMCDKINFEPCAQVVKKY